MLKLSGRSELAGAFRYMLARWPALMRCFDDGRPALDNNAAERALRGVAMRRSLCIPHQRYRGSPVIIIHSRRQVMR